MKRIATLLIAAAAAAALPAMAQTNPYAGRGFQTPRESYGSYRGAEPRYPQRGSETYSVPRGYDGTIRWNTPNKDGNFGGPGGGGSAGATGG